MGQRDRLSFESYKTGLHRRFVSEATSFGLATAENVLGQALSTVQPIRMRLEEPIFLRLLTLQRGFEQRPAATDPMAVASINEFVGPTCKAAFRGILSRR